MKKILLYLILLLPALAFGQAGLKQSAIATRNNSADLYPLMPDTLLRGGLRIVANVTERNAIPHTGGVRKLGMLVLQQSDSTIYRLGFPITSDNWYPVQSGYSQFKTDSLLSLRLRISDTTSMLGPYMHNPLTSLGQIIYSNSTGKPVALAPATGGLKFLAENPAGSPVAPTWYDASNTFINNSATYQTGAQFNVLSGTAQFLSLINGSNRIGFYDPTNTYNVQVSANSLGGSYNAYLPNKTGNQIIAMQSDIPSPGNYIQNGTTPQTANFNISGAGTMQQLSISGTTGPGINLTSQPGTHVTPTTGQDVYADASGRFTIMGANGFYTSFSKSAYTASHIVYLPDATDTLTNAGRLRAYQTYVSTNYLTPTGAATITNKIISVSGNNITSTANRAAQFNASTGYLEPSAITNTELSYLSGVSSAIQTQINGKQSTLPLGIANQGLYINAAGTAYENRTWAFGNSGTDVNVVYTSTTNTLNFPDASATARGLLTTGVQILAGAKTWQGNQTISNALPSFTLTDANSRSAIFTKDPTLNNLYITSPVSRPGGQGGAIMLNGTSQYLAQSITMSSAIGTFSFWFKTTSTGTSTLFHLRGGTIGTSVEFQLVNGRVYVMANAGGQNTYPGVQLSSTAYNDGNWHYFVHANTSGANNQTYVDNVQIDVGKNLAITTSTVVISIGAANTGATTSPAAGTYFPGELDQFLIYSGTAFTSANVNTMWFSGSGLGSPITTNLFRRFDFDVSATLGLDGTGNSNVTVFNTPTFDANGKVAQAGSVQTGQPFSYIDGGNNNELGQAMYGDPLGGTVLQGRAIRHYINSHYVLLQGLDGGTMLDPLLTASLPDINGSYNTASILGFGATTASRAQTYYSGSGVAYTGTQDGAFWYLTGQNPFMRINGTNQQYAFLTDLTGIQITTAATSYQILNNPLQVIRVTGSSLTTLTTPVTTTLGYETTIFCANTAGCKIAQNAGDKFEGITNTTAGTAGFISMPTGTAIVFKVGVASTGTGGTNSIISTTGTLAYN